MVVLLPSLRGYVCGVFIYSSLCVLHDFSHSKKSLNFAKDLDHIPDAKKSRIFRNTPLGKSVLFKYFLVSPLLVTYSVVLE